MNLLLSKLSEEYERRKRVNPRYSIRAFARFLDVDHSLLTKILNGKRKLSAQTACHIAEKLNFEASLVLAAYKKIK